jgi:hypothetical protein
MHHLASDVPVAAPEVFQVQPHVRHWHIISPPIYVNHGLLFAAAPLANGLNPMGGTTTALATWDKTLSVAIIFYVTKIVSCSIIEAQF